MVNRGVVALVFAACSSDELVVVPVVETPTGTDADPFPDLDTIELAVAVAGSPEDLVTRTFVRGESLELTGVPYGENLVIHMIGRARGAEVAVGRSCAVSIQASGAPPRPHLYFARTVKWADAGTPSEPVRSSGSALTTPTGRGLFIGGRGQVGPLAAIDQFDPLNGAHGALANVTPRSDGAVAQLGDGRVVIVGGVDATGAPSHALDVLDPGAAAERRVETIDAGPLVSAIPPALAALSDGRVIAFGGASESGTALGGVVEIGGEGGGVTLRQLRAQLQQPRSRHTATRLSDDLGAPVLIAGGAAAAGPIADAELYKPLVDDLVPLATRMQVPRYGHRAVRLPDGSVLIVGGLGADLRPVADLEVFSLESGFQRAGTLPPTAGLVDQSITTLPDGRILLAGGRAASGLVVDTAFIIRLDPLGGGIDVATTDRLSAPRASHQATPLCDGTVMIVGGSAESLPAERYNPPAAGRR